MEKYYNRVKQGSSKNIGFTPNVSEDVEFVADPGLRKSIISFDVNKREKIRRAYLQKGPCQPRNYNFPWKNKSRFISSWFDEYSDWLEYSITKDAVFCLCCYLFKIDNGDQDGGDSFTGDGFRNWKKKNKLDDHVGDFAHSQCMKACKDLMNHNWHYEVHFSKNSEKMHVLLTASVKCVKFLLRQEIALVGHDKFLGSSNEGNFLELLPLHAIYSKEEDKVVLQDALKNDKSTLPKILHDIINAIAIEVTNTIYSEIGDELFSIFVDAAWDMSGKLQLAIVLRFVDKRGFVVERFVGLVHASEITSLSLKKAIDHYLSGHGLSISRLRGQGYNGTSNTVEEFNGLKSLILKENESAFCVHSFAHQLQLRLAAVAEKHIKVCVFFYRVASLMNVVRASCKRKDFFQGKQFEDVIQQFCDDKLLTERGLNKENTLKGEIDTRWGCHHGTLKSLVSLFSSILDVLFVIDEEEQLIEYYTEANALIERIQCFDFIFMLHLMKLVSGITNGLSQALQRKDRDIINTMTLVKIAKQQLQKMRDDEWESLLDEASLFCIKHEIVVPKMEDLFVVQGRSRRKLEKITNLDYYRGELFYSVIDSQLEELNDRFSEVNMELLICMVSLDPKDSFSAFDKHKLIRFAKLYPSDFSAAELLALEYQLDNYILDVRSNEQFSDVVGVSGLAQKLVQLKKDQVYPLVYLLIKLSLILPVATATVERECSAMKIIKSQLEDQHGDELMNNYLIGYIEKDLVENLKNEEIVQRVRCTKS